MMEIPAGKVCEGTFGSGRELQYWVCPLYLYSNDDGSENCSVFNVNLYAKKCTQCLSAYPNGAVIEIKPK